MEKKFINYQHQAVYYKVGSLSPDTKNIWLLFHGYGQLAEEFRTSFKLLETEENFLLFPQGLSKFYLKGVGNKIGTSWMTSLDREADIANYLAYLDTLYEGELASFAEQKKIIILGFSQGGHTASRWIAKSHIRYDQLILWGTSLAHEIDRTDVKHNFSSGENTLVIGDEDRFIDAKRLAVTRKRYSRIGFSYNLVEYHGGHDIYPDVLQRIISGSVNDGS